MMIAKMSSFKSHRAEGQGSTDLLCDMDRNQRLFQQGNGEDSTKVPKESSPTPNGDGFFYKRRRLSRGGVAVLQEKKPQDQSSDFVRGSNKCTTISTSLAKSLHRGNLPSKSSKNALVQKVSQGALTHISCKKLCLSILNEAAVPGDHCNSSQTFNQNDIRVTASLPCKACGKCEESSKMLICDCCEEAYHLSCCKTVTKNLEEDEDWFEWYCLACSIRKQAMRSSLEDETSGKGGSISCNPIQAMLGDKRSYRTAVRIGEDFQADVPDWVGPTKEESSDYFSKPKELDMIDDDSTSKLWCNRPRSRSFGNWVQCQEIIHVSSDDEVTICGKWRRVPFEVVQTDDWDCSCLLPHDPFHADCAVPQEAENGEVIKQLKVLASARHLLENHRKKS